MKDTIIVIVWNVEDVLPLQLVSQLHDQPEFIRDGKVENACCCAALMSKIQCLVAMYTCISFTTNICMLAHFR